MYRSVPREQIAGAVAHLRDLFRGHKPSSEQEGRRHEKREAVAKNLLSNLLRTKEHPTLQSVLEVADVFSLTLDGAHRLFGYQLDGIQAYDFRFNGARTHIIESYLFDRDLPVEVPLQFGSNEVFARSASLHELVTEWQTNIPIRALDVDGWQHAGSFYIHVGTEDSLGSSLPPGAIGLVSPIDEAERLRPNPRAVYLLQFGNGYRCSRCVVSGGKLILLTTGRNYSGPEEFAYPEDARIAGRIRMFALQLPLPEYSLLRTLPPSSHGAPLILPWEHSSIDRLLNSKHRRFRRSAEEVLPIKDAMEIALHTRLSGRTERRYRGPTSSQPHVDALVQITLSHLTRYTDALRVHRPTLSDRGKFSLEHLLNIEHFADLSLPLPKPHIPKPPDRWMALRNEFFEWAALLSHRYPQLSRLNQQVVRLAQGIAIQGIEPPISAGSLTLLEKLSSTPDPRDDRRKTGWSRPIYAFRRKAEIFWGHIERDGNQYVLLSNGNAKGAPISFDRTEFAQLNKVVGVAVPV